MIYFHLSHTDLDGYGCQIIMDAISKHGIQEDEKSPREPFEVRFFNSNYGSEIDTTLEEIKKEISVESSSHPDEKIRLLITDLNLSISQAEFLESMREEIPNLELILLDHHISGKDTAENRDWYHLDTEQSATMLTYKYVVQLPGVQDIPGYGFNLGPQILQIANIIDSYDLWKTENTEWFQEGKMYSFYLNLLNQFVPRSILKDKHDRILRYMVANIGSISTDATLYNLFRKAICDAAWIYNSECSDDLGLALEELLLSYLNNSYGFRKNNVGIISTIDNKTYNLVFINSKVHIPSIVMNRFLKDNVPVWAVGVVYDNGTCSLRSDGLVDVSEIAKKLGGGGHKNAAGCSFKPKSEVEGNYMEYILDRVSEKI